MQKTPMAELMQIGQPKESELQKRLQILEKI